MKLKISKILERLALEELKNFKPGELRKISQTDFFIAEPTNPKIKQGIVIGSVAFKGKEYFLIQFI